MKPKILKNYPPKYWSKYASDGGIATCRVRAEDEHQAGGEVANRYGREAHSAGQYFAYVSGIKRVKRNEFLVDLQFGWDI